MFSVWRSTYLIDCTRFMGSTKVCNLQLANCNFQKNIFLCITSHLLVSYSLSLSLSLFLSYLPSCFTTRSVILSLYWRIFFVPASTSFHFTNPINTKQREKKMKLIETELDSSRLLSWPNRWKDPIPFFSVLVELWLYPRWSMVIHRSVMKWWFLGCSRLVEFVCHRTLIFICHEIAISVSKKTALHRV